MCVSRIFQDFPFFLTTNIAVAKRPETDASWSTHVFTDFTAACQTTAAVVVVVVIPSTDLLSKAQPQQEKEQRDGFFV